MTTGTEPEPAAPGMPLPEITELNKPFWDGLRQGELRHQTCQACGNAWLPAREACPRCLSDDTGWAASSGSARLISWVVYRNAFHPAFAARVPYTVAVVELEEGARLITNVLGDAEALRIEMPLTLTIEQEEGLSLPRFVPA